MGQARENSRNYKAAVEVYSRAFELPQEKNEIWYFLNNNLAYCLNQERLYMQAQKHCRVAIEIDSQRHNAHKNLGIALQGEKHYADAAMSFICATRLCPADGRALGLLENLLFNHSEVLENDPDLLVQLNECHEAVNGAHRRVF
jgi:tetratricopeptide (TPR) repeat protein